MTFVCASAGFGKTTLLVDFVNDVDANICWYQINSAESDFPTFFRYFISAIQQVYPGLGKDLLNLVNEPKRVNPRSVALEFTNEALVEIKDYTLLVLDDYHLISQNFEIVSFMETVLENLPDQMRILVGSRSVYGIPSAELYVREELALVSAEDLRFTANELIDLSRLHFQVKLSEDKAEQIIKNTEGWIIAILLALRGEHPAAIIPKLAGAKEHIHQYLKEEVLDRIDPQVRKFMLVTSLFNEFTIEQSNYVLEIDNAGEMIKQLEDQNLFISRSETLEGYYYQYHQLFREFLLIDLHKEFDLQAVNAYHSRSADYFAKNGYDDLAIDHLLSAGRKKEAALLMDKVSLAYSSSGRQNQLRNWYAHISDNPQLLKIAPHLVLHIARISINLGELDEVSVLLDPVEEILRAQNDNESLISLLAAKGLAYRFTGKYEACINLGKEIISLAKAEKLDRYYLYQGERLIGIAAHFLDQNETAVDHLERAVDGMRKLCAKVQQDNMYHDLIMTLADLGFVTIKTGDIFLAQKCFKEALETSQRLRGHQGDVAMSANNQAYLYYLQGDYAQAWKYYNQALEAAMAAGWRRIIVDIFNGKGDLLRDIGQWDKATEQYKRALEYESEGQEDIAFWDTHMGLAELERLQGSFNNAMYHLREAAHWSKESIEQPKYQLGMAHIYLNMGHNELSRIKIDEAIMGFAKEERASADRARAYLLLTELEYIEGKIDAARQAMKQALKDIAILGFDDFFVVKCKEALGFLTNLQEAWQNKQLADVIERAKEFNVNYSDLYITSEEEPEEDLPVVQISAFGQGEIRTNSHLIPNSQWKSVGARALFFYILDNKQVTKDEISLEFWPDFSQAKVNSNFHATLWRVRNALGKKGIIDFEDPYYRLNQAGTYYYDVGEFEELVKNFNNGDKDTTDKRDWGHQAVSLYKNDFLVDIDMRWTSDRRQELHQKFTQLVGELANIEYEEGHFENARDLYQRAIGLDEFQDDYHFGLIRSMIALGERSAAKTHLDGYKQTLYDELGIEPTEEFKEFSNLIEK